MKISVRTRGGVLGLDRLVEVEDGRATVSERGVSRSVVLDAEQTSRVAQAVERVATVPVSTVGDPLDATDTGSSDIEIADGGAHQSLHVPTGVDAPEEVWDLLDVVEEVAEMGQKGG